jgi:hypothetical protein
MVTVRVAGGGKSARKRLPMWQERQQAYAEVGVAVGGTAGADDDAPV